MELILVFEVLLLMAIAAGAFIGWKLPGAEQPASGADRTKMPEPSA